MSDPEPAAPSDSAPERGPRWWVVFLGSTALFAAVLLYHNFYLFREPIYEESDSAANSLLVLKAKRLELLHGHYSRFLFYHPGPGLLYVEAAGEYLFYDLLGAVPAPHNGQIFGLLLMHSALVGVAITCVVGATGSARLGAAVALAFLVYFARESHLGSHWFANVFMLVYLPFQVSAASVASGRTNHLGWMALTGGLSVHSHVCFVAFVVPISLYALYRAWAAGGYRLRTLPAPERRSWAVFVAVVGLFVLPIVLHTALHYPGEVGRYLSYTRPPAPAARTVGDVCGFLVRCVTNESEPGWPLLLGVAAGALVAVATFPEPYRRFARQLGLVAALTSAVMVYYVARSVDDYRYTYVGKFFASVLLVGWALIAMRVAALARGPAARGLTIAAALVVGAWAAYTGRFNNGYHGSPESVALAEAIANDPRWEEGAPAVTIHENGWIEATALVLQLERRGKRVWVVERGWDILLTDRFRPDGRRVNARWRIDVVEPSVPRDGVRRVLAEYNGTSFREMETRVPLGAPVPLGKAGRVVGAEPLGGWYSAGHLDYLIPSARESALAIDLDRCPTREVRLTLSGVAIGPNTLAAGGQHVGVVVNGEAVGAVTFGSVKEPEERSLVFPAAVLNRESPARIVFTFPDAAEYRRRFAPRPPVLYSIQLRALTLTPVP
ncbi:MAG: hypothetical protein J0I06_26075 [Planctomycetes bacterium]|nr:hypothetical protein [Planctomycetota bacterium]